MHLTQKWWVILSLCSMWFVLGRGSCYVKLHAYGMNYMVQSTFFNDHDKDHVPFFTRIRILSSILEMIRCSISPSIPCYTPNDNPWYYAATYGIEESPKTGITWLMYGIIFTCHAQCNLALYVFYDLYHQQWSITFASMLWILTKTMLLPLSFW